MLTLLFSTLFLLDPLAPIYGVAKCGNFYLKYIMLDYKARMFDLQAFSAGYLMRANSGPAFYCLGAAGAYTINSPLNLNKASPP